MNADTTGLCRDHSFESAEDICRRCGAEYCELCLVYPMGKSKALCKECAMAAGGVRSHVTRAPMAKKDIRRRLKAFEARRSGRTARSSNFAAAEAPELVLTDPLAQPHHDPEPIAAPVPVPVPDDGAAFAEELAQSFDTVALPLPTAAEPPGEQPAEGVAPPIDWNQPFG